MTHPSRKETYNNDIFKCYTYRFSEYVRSQQNHLVILIICLSSLISLWQQPYQSGSSLIFIRQLPDQSGNSQILLRQLSD